MSQRGLRLDRKNDNELAKNVAAKITYLTELHAAISKHDDLHIYKLLNAIKYYQIMKKRRFSDKHNHQALVIDQLPRLRHYLSHRLIKYLKQVYPFFYYYEDHLGHYQVYFGDWWGHKLFGTLDVINVKFDFDPDEYRKLEHTFDHQNSKGVDTSVKKIKQRNNKLSRLAKTQSRRDNLESELKSDLKINKSQARFPWNVARIRNERNMITEKLKKLDRIDETARNAKSQMRSNHHRMLEASKENTVINYEKRCIKDYFGTLDQFNENNKRLYYNYLSFLINGGEK